MENASKAMKQIHGGLTVDKVDETMYAAPCQTLRILHSLWLVANLDGQPGTNCGNKTRSARRSSTLLRATPSASLSTRTSWMLSWRSCNKSSWMNRCSKPGQYRSLIKSSACLLYQQETVSYAVPSLPFRYDTNRIHSQGQDVGCRGRRRRRRAAQAAGGNGHVRSRPEVAARCSQDSTASVGRHGFSKPITCKDRSDKMLTGGDFDLLKPRLACPGRRALYCWRWRMEAGLSLATQDGRHITAARNLMQVSTVCRALLLHKRACTASASWSTLRLVQGHHIVLCMVMV